MIVDLYIPKTVDSAILDVLERFYPGYRGHEGLSGEPETYNWWVGNDDEGEDEVEYLTYDEAVECCGIVEGLIDEAECVIDGSGPWAMSMIRKTDFSDYAITDEQKADWKERSDRFWAAFQRGRDARPIAAGN